MPLDNTSAAVIGAILGPTAGLIGTKLKDMAEKRDAKRRAQELVKEAADLLGFADTLQKSAAGGGLVAKVPSTSLDSLQTTVVNKITSAIAEVCRPAASTERKPRRTMLDKILLMHRPFAWWGWPVHILYYLLAGIFLVTAALAVSGYWNRASDSGDVWLGFLIFSIFFGTLAAAVNLICNAFIKRLYEGEKAAATSKSSAGI